MLFRVEDSCIAAHLGERAVKSGLDEDGPEVHDASSASQHVSPRPDTAPGPDEPREGSVPQQPDALAAFMDSGLEALPGPSGRGPGGARHGAAAHSLQAQFQRYGLDDGRDAGVEAEAPTTDAHGAQDARAVRHLSARERQALKSAADATHGTPQGQRGDGRGSSTAATTADKGQGPTARRGKKAGSKYVDDEDAELARQALQSGGEWFLFGPVMCPHAGQTVRLPATLGPHIVPGATLCIVCRLAVLHGPAHEGEALHGLTLDFPPQHHDRHHP